MKAKKEKKVASKTSRIAVRPQAGQNEEAKARCWQADAGTQSEDASDQLQEEEQE